MFSFLKRKPTVSQNSNTSMLFADQKRLVPAASVIFDVGMQHGHTTKEYLEGYPQACVYAFEAEHDNFERGKSMLKDYGSRVQLLETAVSDTTGRRILNINTHDGTHSLLEVGAVQYWLQPASTKQRMEVDCVALDDFCQSRSISHIDILKMDIQGAELQALTGARQLLAKKVITLLALEVEFRPLYKGQPLYEDIAIFLRGYGYRLLNFYDLKYVNGVLSWADAIFVPDNSAP